MDDLAGKLSDLLNNPEVMQQLQGLTGLLGKPEDSPKQIEKNETNEKPSFSLPDENIMNAMLKIAPLLSNINREDKYTKFLNSLRPLLHEPRQKKLDEVSKILKLIRIIPILKNEGIF